MKRLQLESLESRRLMTTTTHVDLYPGPEGSNPHFLGTVGKTVIVEATVPECSQPRCILGVNAIDHTYAVLGEYDAYGSIEDASVEDEADTYVMFRTRQGLVWTDGVTATSIPGDEESLAEYYGEAYWLVGSGGGNTTDYTTMTLDGPVSTYAGFENYCTDFDGCDYVKMIGVVDGDVYYQRADARTDFGMMHVYRNSEAELMFSTPWVEMPYVPELRALSYRDQVVFEYTTPSWHNGWIDSDGNHLLTDVLYFYLSRDNKELWYFTNAEENYHYDPTGPDELLLNDEALHRARSKYNGPRSYEPLQGDSIGFATAEPDYGYMIHVGDFEVGIGSELKIFNAEIGDSDFENGFDSGDLVNVFQAGLYETGKKAMWMQGDWNFDGLFDSADLVLAFQAGTYEN